MQATQKIELTKEYIEEFQKQNETKTKKEESSISQYFSSKYEQLKDTLDLKERFHELEKKVDASYRSIVDLITLFIIQSVLFPLLFLWIFILLLRTLFQIDTREKFSHFFFC